MSFQPVTACFRPIPGRVTSALLAIGPELRVLAAWRVRRLRTRTTEA
jgi:hypothetical protein